jgi:hypothetical protein
MGFMMSKPMEENLKKNQEFITEMNKITVSNVWYIYSLGSVKRVCMIALSCDECLLMMYILNSYAL